MITKFKRPMIMAAVAVALLGSAGFSSFANAKSAAQTASAKITLEEAINKAQAENKGKVTKAKLEDEEGKLVYAVEFRNGGKEHEVLVDAQTGALTNGDDD